MVRGPVRISSGMRAGSAWRGLLQPGDKMVLEASNSTPGTCMEVMQKREPFSSQWCVVGGGETTGMSLNKRG